MSLPYKMSERERDNLQQSADYSQVQSLPEVWELTAQRFGDITALHAPHNKPEIKLTYAQMNEQIQQFAVGLQTLGVQPKIKIALFSDNSPRWFVADQGTMRAGAVDIVRSSQADEEELSYIYKNSESSGLIAENLETYHKLKSRLKDLPLNFVILLSDEEPESEEVKMLNFEGVLAAGDGQNLNRVEQNPDTLATLLYTSGTTGKPKGVMLSHGNLLHQVRTLGTIINPKPRDRVLSLLPSWHAYERAAEYFLLSQGATQIYTTRRAFQKDLQEYHVQYMVGVPRLWESIHDKVKKQLREQPKSRQRLANFFLSVSGQYLEAKKISKGLSLDHPKPSGIEKFTAKAKGIFFAPLHALGDRLVYQKVRQAVGGEIKTVISGGGSLARSIDKFYAMVGIPLIVGYGLTETSPVTNARRPWKNIIGAAGQPIPGTETRIVDLETRQTLSQGEKGLILVRGPQVMQGYYNLPEATEKAIDQEGWFDTGDIGYIAQYNNLVITGRAKDTIVLNNGENIEPQPIEDACLRSDYIDQIMLVGQDQQSLGALIVPNKDELEAWARENNQDIPLDDQEALNECSPVRDLFRKELNREVKNRPGYSGVDRIGPFTLILEPFSEENGMMTQTLKIKRPVVSDHYRDTIDKMFN
jgi:long-chain acyl-CoA synthetase